MRVMHRIIHKIAPDKWGEVLEWERKYGAIEAPYGIPPKRFYRAVFGADDGDTLIVEQEWESMADFEERYTKAAADPAWQKVDADSASVFLTIRHEIYAILE